MWYALAGRDAIIYNLILTTPQIMKYDILPTATAPDPTKKSPVKCEIISSTQKQCVITCRNNHSCFETLYPQSLPEKWQYYPQNGQKKFVGKQMENEQNQIQCRKMSKVHSSCVEDYGHFNYILTGEWTRKISLLLQTIVICIVMRYSTRLAAVQWGEVRVNFW